MSRIVFILFVCFTSALYGGSTVIDDFSDGDFLKTADLSTTSRSLSLNQVVSTLPGSSRRIKLGTFAGHDGPSPTALIEVQSGRLRVDSDFVAEAFRVKYGVLDGEVDRLEGQLSLDLDLSDAVFTLEFDYYVPGQATTTNSVCISVLSGSFSESQFASACLPLFASESPFAVSIPMSNFTGTATLTDIDQLTLSVGNGFFSPASFSLAVVHYTPEPSALLSTCILLVLIVPFSRSEKREVRSEK